MKRALEIDPHERELNRIETARIKGYMTVAEANAAKRAVEKARKAAQR